jgi:signal transduction histidine kinase
MLQETQGAVHVGPLPTVEADPVQMRQVLQNLIANALKFHRPGVAPEVVVEPAPSAAPELVAFTVSDNGIGFEPRYAGRIFRVFERLHGRGTYPGTGIGLALCRMIVERHGGTISVESIPGEGSTFKVTLPLKPIDLLAAPTPPSETQEEEPLVTA